VWGVAISNIIQFDRAMMIYKIVIGLCPDSLRGRLIPRSHYSNCSKRNQLDLEIPRLSIEISKDDFFILE